MKTWIRKTWTVFKWSSVAVVVMFLALIFLWPKFGPKPPTSTALISSTQNGCQFTFDVVSTNWIPDDVSGTKGLVPSNSGTKPSLFLNGQRYWKGTAENGGWDTPVSRQCDVTSRGDVVTEEGYKVTLFLARQCKPDDKWDKDRATENLLFGRVIYDKDAKTADFIWMASDSLVELLGQESTLEKIIKSHSTKNATCLANKTTDSALPASTTVDAAAAASPGPQNIISAEPEPAPAPAGPAFNQAIDGKLNAELVKNIIHKSMEFADSNDYRSRCTLSGPDINFSITDNGSVPAMAVQSGGRAELCDLQQENADMLRGMRAKATVEIGELKIIINSALTQAFVQHEQVTIAAKQGQQATRRRCTQKSTLAVYNDKVLYKDLVSVCAEPTR